MDYLSVFESKETHIYDHLFDSSTFRSFGMVCIAFIIFAACMLLFPTWNYHSVVYFVR